MLGEERRSRVGMGTLEVQGLDAGHADVRVCTHHRERSIYRTHADKRGEGAMARPTIVDVAKAAGVSRATAARVLAGATNVDPVMTSAVAREAANLGYETNFAARMLRGGRAGAARQRWADR